MSTIKDGGPAFPGERKFKYYQMGERTGTEVMPGMTLREYAAIKLRVPDSGTDWLDDMIRQSLRDELAGKALQGMLANGEEPSLGPEFEAIANHYATTAYLYADAMLRARDQEPS